MELPRGGAGACNRLALRALVAFEPAADLGERLIEPAGPIEQGKVAMICYGICTASMGSDPEPQA
jgi:hypothetical protein